MEQTYKLRVYTNNGIRAVINYITENNMHVEHLNVDLDTKVITLIGEFNPTELDMIFSQIPTTYSFRVQDVDYECRTIYITMEERLLRLQKLDEAKKFFETRDSLNEEELKKEQEKWENEEIFGMSDVIKLEELYKTAIRVHL